MSLIKTYNVKIKIKTKNIDITKNNISIGTSIADIDINKADKVQKNRPSRQPRHINNRQVIKNANKV